jgi:hypothetical protein
VAVYQHKQGHTFTAEVTTWLPGRTEVRDLTGCTVTSTIEHTGTGERLDLTVAVTNAAGGVFTISATADQLADVPTGRWALDWLIEEDGEYGGSATTYIDIVRRITRAV